MRRAVADPFRIFTVNAGAEIALSGLTIENGLDDVQGGGVANFGGVLTVANSVVRDNEVTASQGGGGLFTRNGGSLTIVNTTVTENTVTGTVGGGIRTTFGSALTVINSTVVGNTAAVGGGISSGQSDSDATILNSTVAANSAPDGANFSLAAFDAVKILRSTIVSDPLGGGANCLISGDESPSQGYNLADDDSCRLTATADQPNTSPNLGPLADNGGPTPTMEPEHGSPAIDKGTAGTGIAGIGVLSTDQRGHPRPSVFFAVPNAPGGDGSDIGAFERTSNQFAFRKVKRNARNGTARLVVRIAGPGRLVLKKTSKLRRSKARAESAGPVRLEVRPRGKAKRKLAQARELGRKVRVTVRARITYRPDAGEPKTKLKRLRLTRK